MSQIAKTEEDSERDVEIRWLTICFTKVQFLWQDDLVSVARFIADYFDHFQSGGDPSQSALGGWNRCKFLLLV